MKLTNLFSSIMFLCLEKSYEHIGQYWQMMQSLLTDIIFDDFVYIYIYIESYKDR